MSATEFKRLNKEYYYPTQIYFTDLPNGSALNEKMLPCIYNWREKDPEGVLRGITASSPGRKEIVRQDLKADDR